MVPFKKPNPYPKNDPRSDPDYVPKLKLPLGREVLAVVERRLGGSRMTVRCFDGVTRLARIPGRLKKRLWIRETDIVIIEPWEYSNDKCDVLYKYTKNQIIQLKQKGLLEMLSDVEEF